jgi:hypothetical protein
MGNSPHTASIHILDDDSLLNMFYLYCPFLLGEDKDNNNCLIGGLGRWVCRHWWHKLVHVCRRWRNITLGSVSYLGLSLVCTNGTPVADMLAHSLPLPLLIDYCNNYHNITAEDKEGAILALRQCDHVCRIHFSMPATNLQKLIVAIDEEYPILEYLVIWDWTGVNSTTLILPETLQAPHLCHLTLIGFALLIGLRLLMTAVGLVTLCLRMVHPSTYFDPNTLL